MRGVGWNYYRHHSEGMGKVMFSVLSVHIQGWRVPHLHPITLPSTGPMSFLGGGRVTTVPGPMSLPEGGVPQSQMGVPWPGQDGVPTSPQLGLDGYNPLPGLDGVAPSPGDRPAEGVLTTRRAVCLLRSRRRTFLFC